MLFGKFCIDDSSAQFNMIKHCTEPENTEMMFGRDIVPTFQSNGFGISFSCFIRYFKYLFNFLGGRQCLVCRLLSWIRLLSRKAEGALDWRSPSVFLL